MTGSARTYLGQARRALRVPTLARPDVPTGPYVWVGSGPRCPHDGEYKEVFVIGGGEFDGQARLCDACGRVYPEPGDASEDEA